MLRKTPQKAFLVKGLENRLSVENVSKTEADTSFLNQAFSI